MAHVLLVGDAKSRTHGLKSILAMHGHAVTPARVPSRWRETERTSAPEVVVAAVEDPGEVLRVPLGGGRVFAPAILFVHQEQDAVRDHFAEERLIDQLTSPFPAEDLLARVDALARVRRIVLRQDRAEAASQAPSERPLPGGWRALGSRVAAALRHRVPSYEIPSGPYHEVASRVAEWSDRRDSFDPGHADRVTAFSAMIAEELGMPDAEVGALLRAALLHDIGKIGLPVEVLRQVSPLDDAQLRLLRSPADRGAAILRALEGDDAVASAVRFHHEHVDGSGYNGRAGESIPLSARILAVAEAYDAMTTSRVRKRLSPYAAMGIIKEKRGSQWDARCVDALAQALKPRPETLVVS